MNEIEKFDGRELAWNDKPVRSSDIEIVRILAPMFASFPQTKADKNTVDNYVEMLRDIAPDALAAAVLKLKATSKFLPTIAELREQAIGEQRAPGPSVPTPQSRMNKPIPTTFYRLPEDEDKAQRLNRLRMTRQPGDRI